MTSQGNNGVTLTFMSSPPIVLSIAGFDPSSGAGVTADIKTAAAHGCYAVTCITALTVQSTRGVREVVGVAPELVRATLRELAADLPPAAVHIGMLGNAGLAAVVADYLEQYSPPNVVLDPILRSSSGAALLKEHDDNDKDEAGLALLRTRLLPRAHVITPNLEEAAALAGVAMPSTAFTPEQMALLAARLHRLGARAVVVTGGHLPGDETIDLLSVKQDEAGNCSREFRGPKLKTTATHGTGCALSTALACNLARGLSLPDAVGAAKQYVATAMASARRLGSGAGPLHHLYCLGEFAG